MLRSRIIGSIAMPKIEIVRIGTEGGGGTLFRDDESGSAVFWFKGSQMGLDENDDEMWIPWLTQPSDSLAAALPRNWQIFIMRDIHPDYAAEIEALRATGPVERRP